MPKNTFFFFYFIFLFQIKEVSKGFFWMKLWKEELKKWVFFYAEHLKIIPETFQRRLLLFVTDGQSKQKEDDIL